MLAPAVAGRTASAAGLRWLLAAQFLSALADNALLVVAIALLQRRGVAAWWVPALKLGFTLSYVGLAPWVGPLADTLRKGRLMIVMNGVKLAGTAALLADMHPVAGYAIVGIGAAAYAPAKYGLVTELVPARALVIANGWLEVSVVGAVLLGTAAGGALVSPAWLAGTGGLDASLLVVLGLYLAAAAFNLGVPDSGARYPLPAFGTVALIRDFWSANLRLWRDTEGGLSLAATTLIWGVGATLQFIVLRWATETLALGLDRAAYLQASVAVGLIAGAGAAGRWVALRHARRVLGAGVVLGLLLPLLTLLREPVAAALLLAGAGALAGLLVVPLNALLQHRGCTLLSAGRSIAVQGFNENASVLAMLAGYAVLVALQWPIERLMIGLGLGTAAAVMVLMRIDRRRGHKLAPDNGAAVPERRDAAAE